MGQYYIAINTTKREYVSPWDLGGLAKLWEWCAGRTAGIFPYLLRKSSESGGGDIESEDPAYAGRWSGDQVYVVGDYDKSKLYDTAQQDFTNISAPLVAEYNSFIELPKLQLGPHKA